MRCWPNGDECKALGAANSLAYSQAEQRCRRAVWLQPGGTGRFGDNSVVAGRWQWAGTAALPAPRTARQSASVAYATVSPTGSQGDGDGRCNRCASARLIAMTCFDVFNGDADGICSLLQLRLA